MLNIHGLLHRSASINLWLSVRLVVSVICIVAIPAYAAPDRPKLSEIIEVSNTDSQKVNIEIGQSLILDIPKGVRTIYVSEPALLDTNLKNANQLAVSGRIAGTTDL